VWSRNAHRFAQAQTDAGKAVGAVKETESQKGGDFFIAAGAKIFVGLYRADARRPNDCECSGERAVGVVLLLGLRWIICCLECSLNPIGIMVLTCHWMSLVESL